MQDWITNIRRLKDKEVGVNIKIMTSEFFQVDPRLYGDLLLPWQKSLAKNIPRHDLEVLVQVSKLFDIQNDPLAEADEEEEALDDDDDTLEDMDATEEQILERTMSTNIDARMNTSADNLEEYNTFKGRKMFKLYQNMMQTNGGQFTLSLRLDAKVCPFFDDVTNRFCTGETEGQTFCPKHQRFENTNTMRTIRKLLDENNDQSLGHIVASGIFRQALPKLSSDRVFQYLPSLEGAGPIWKEILQNFNNWLKGSFEVYQSADRMTYESFPFEM